MAVDAGTIYSEIRIQLDKLSGDITKVNALFDKIPEGAGKAADQAQKKVTSSMESIGSAVKNAALTFGLTQTLLRGLDFNKAAESAQISFGVMLGSTEKAKAMLTDLKQYADTTPLEFKDIRAATQTMLQFGISGKDSLVYLKQLGDVSGGDAEKLKSLTLAFSQVSSAGKLQGQDLLQLINAGFNPLKEISERTGVSMAKLKDEMAAGNISFKMVEESFKNVTSEGGLFFGMLDKNSKSLAGVQSTLNDATDTLLGKITEAFLPAIKSISLFLIDLFNGIGKLPAPILAVVGTLGALAAGFFGVSAAAGALAPALVPILAATGPFILIAGAVAAVAVGISAAADAQTKYNLQLKENVAIAGRNMVAAREITGATDKASSSQKINAEQVAALVKIYPELSRVLKTNVTSMEEAAKAAEEAGKKAAKNTLDIALAQPRRDLEAVQQAVFAAERELANRRKIAGLQQTDTLRENAQRQIDSQREILAGLYKNRDLIQAEIAKLRASSGLFGETPADKPKAATVVAEDKTKEEIKKEKDKSDALYKIQQELLAKTVKSSDDKFKIFDAETNAEIEKAKKTAEEKGIPEKEIRDAINAYNVARYAEYQKMLESEDQKRYENLVKTNSDAYADIEKSQLDHMHNTASQAKDAFSTVSGLATQFLSALVDFQTAANEQAISDLEDNYEATKEIRDQEMQDNLERVDIELQAKLESLGVKDESEIDSLTRQVQQAKDSGNQAAADDLEIQLRIAQAKKDAEDKKNQITIDANAADLKAKKDLEKQKAQLEYESSLSAWEMAGLQIQISAAMGIMNAWSQNTWPVAIALTAAIAVIDAVQTAAWASAKPRAPKFATGGIVPGSSFSGDQVTAQVNSGEMILNAMQQAQLFDIANGQKNNGNSIQNMTLIVELDGKTVAQSTVSYIDNGVVRLKIA